MQGPFRSGPRGPGAAGGGGGPGSAAAAAAAMRSSISAAAAAVAAAGRPTANAAAAAAAAAANPAVARQLAQGASQGAPVSVSAQGRPANYKYTANMRNPPPMGGGAGAGAGGPPQQALHIQGQEPLTASMLSSANPQEQKQMLGERLFPLIRSMYPDLAGKITGMLLEIDNSELLHMLEHHESLKAKVEEAVAVLQAHQAKQAAASVKKE